jgi:uncharacterized delta-60 repeat protein
MSPILVIKSGTTAISGATVKGSFSYFSASTLDLGPTSTTGLYAGIDAPDGGYTVYQIGGPNGLNANVASNTDELNLILIGAGATGSTLNDRITWATNTNSIFINSGSTAAIVYYFGGAFTLTNFIVANRAISLNTDGSNDTSFNVGVGFSNTTNSLAIQSDGKILVGGDYNFFSGTEQNHLIRLNSDGSKDTSFDIGSGFGNYVESVAIQSDGKILVGGLFSNYQGDSNLKYFIRFNSDGSVDFDALNGRCSSDVYSIAIQSDGYILVGGFFNEYNGRNYLCLVRVDEYLYEDPSFDIGSGFNNTVFSIAIQSDGYILVGGQFTTFADSTQNRLIRLNSDGSKDTSFDIGTGFGSTVFSIAIQSDGKILVGGAFFTFSGSSQNALIRLNSDGSKDTSFDIGSGLNTTVRSIAVKSDGKIFAGGNFTRFSGTSQNRILKTSNYSLDTSFDIGTGFNSNVNSLSIQSDGKILVGGAFTTFTGATQNRLIKINTNGSKDTSFDIGSGFNGAVKNTATQSDGKIMVGGEFTTFTGSSQNYLIRLNSNGSKDTSFDIGIGFDRNGLLGTSVESIAIQSDGKILVGGLYSRYSASTQNNLIRLNSDGSKDSTFNIGSGFNNTVLPTKIQSDGKILVGGSFTTFTGSSQNYLIRLNSDGSKDTTFNIGSGFNTVVRSIDIQSDGKILVGGDFTTFTGATQDRLIRLNSNGSKDTSFNIGTGFDSVIRSIDIQSDGKILVGGDFTTYQGVSSFRNILLNSDGSVSNNGLLLSSTVNSIAIQQ